MAHDVYVDVINEIDLFVQGNGFENAHYPLILGYYIPIWSASFSGSSPTHYLKIEIRFARLSILFTIIRVAPCPKKRRIILGWYTYSFPFDNADDSTVIGALFVFQCVLLVTQAVWVTETSDPAWKTQFVNQPRTLAIAQLVCTIMSDIPLILLPIWIFRTTELDSALRSRLLAVFSISVAVILAGIAQAVVSFVIGGVPSLLSHVIKVTSVNFGLITVALTLFFRFLSPCLRVTSLLLS